MNDLLKTEFDQLLQQADAARERREFEAAFAALERAHVLAQPYVRPHVRSHYEMLRCARSAGDLREIVGQLARLVLAGPASALGLYPKGNSGRANVSMFKPADR